MIINQMNPGQPTTTLLFSDSLKFHKLSTLKISATVDGGSQQQQLSGRERRELKKERRAGYDWKQEVEERLIKKPKKRYSSELNLDNLALSGPQWWILRVSQLSANYTADLMARSLARNFPHMDFKVYIPSVHIKKRLKSGTISVKPKSLFPGCVFLRCIINKQVHDFILEDCVGVRGFVGVTVGNTKRQINKPRPVDDEDMEVIFRKVKEEQEIAEKAFLEENKEDGSSDPEPSSGFQANSVGGGEHGSLLQPNGRARKAKTSSSASKNIKAVLRPGSPVRIVFGAFAGFSGVLKKASLKKKTVTVAFTLFGKETIADLDVGEVVPDTS